MKELKLDLRPLLKKAFLLTKKDITGSEDRSTGSGKRQAGSRKALFLTKGTEFEKFREYVPGEDGSKIDWIASLRAQRPLIRVYSEEQNKDIIFFLDVSSSMSYSSHQKLKNEYAAELVATLSYALADTGDNIGLVMFTDHIVNIVQPASGKMQFAKIVREITNPQYYEGNFNLSKSLAEFVNYRKRPCALMIISDFIGLDAGWEKIFKIMAGSGYEIIGIMIRDPLDDEFPEGHFIGQVAISDPFSDEQILMDPNKIAIKYKNYNEEHNKKIKMIFDKTGNKMLSLRTNESFIEKIRWFFFPGK